MAPEDRLLVPIPEAQQWLGGIGRSTVYELINAGHITKVNIGTRGFITADSMRAYVGQLAAAA